MTTTTTKAIIKNATITVAGVAVDAAFIAAILWFIFVKLAVTTFPLIAAYLALGYVAYRLLTWIGGKAGMAAYLWLATKFYKAEVSAAAEPTPAV